MYILGLNLLHDTSATLIKNNEIVGAIEEERFNGIKHTNLFPKNSIKWLLDKEKLNIDDVKVVLSYNSSQFNNNFNPFEENTLKNSESDTIVSDNYMKYRNIKNSLVDNGIDKYVEIDHHLAHASAVYLSGYSEASIVVIDGRGEHYSTSLYHYKNNEFKVIEQYSINDSIGHLYTYVTDLCGLYTDRGQEGKTMGLAAYGSYNEEIHDIFQKIIVYKNNKYSINRKEMYRLEKFRDTAFSENSKNLAYCLQIEYEKLLNFIVKNLIETTNCKNVVLSGGVALNCNANGKLVEKLKIKQLYVQPAANDAGTSLGAALNYYYSNNQKKIKYTSDVYLGPEFSNEEIKNKLDLYKIKYRKSKDICSETARYICEGKIIGWFQGKMEFGPRALGNRSILADPRSIKMKNIVNDNVKQRENWRPFAPSILEEYANEYFNCHISSPHMNISFQSSYENKIPAAIHIDKSARIQTVSKKENEKYYNLINEFRKLTKIPVLLNTSFNGKNPIVRTPEDAIRTFYSTGLDILVLNDYIIEKEVY